MVSRKPVPSASREQATAVPPYSNPSTVVETQRAPSPLSTLEQRSPYLMHDNDATVNPWEDASESSGKDQDWYNKNTTNVTAGHPTSLVDVTPDHLEQAKSELHELTPQSSWERDSESSSDEAEAKPSLNSAPSHAPPPPPPPSNTIQPPIKDTNPYRTRSSEGVPRIPVSKEEDSSNIWAELAQDQKPSTSQPVPVTVFEQLGLDDKPGWDSVQANKVDTSLNADSPLIEFDPAEDYKKELEATPFGPPDGLEDIEQNQTGKGKGKVLVIPSEGNEEVFPPPAHPPPPKSVTKFSDRKITVSEEVVNKQRSETYQIKHVRWADSNSHEIRTSPILIQNKNGPCPLMALVNALTLSTPSELNTALIETLRVREQISLGLLLDAVFDELMSGRRGDAAQGLPDVSELYAFLITLHTGMNVNPRFIPAQRMEQSLMDGSYEAVPLTTEDYRKPGSFEDTKEMMLYGTFSIPLIHGWLPSRSHPAFRSIERSAVTYEDAQNLMFREEELEDKVRASGLNQSEQQLLEDITSIKYFLSSTATQLTAHGLETINEALQPGAIAILFRNDHFSTLYKQPRSGQLLSLVTDAGYSTHDEIVWESLADVSGEGSEFFSGDFRPVGGNPNQSQAFDQSGSTGSEWQTINRAKGRNTGQATTVASNLPPSNNDNQTPSSPTGRDHEQEDADLALAMQLQEEEEENSRRTSAQRRRQEEEQASTHYLGQTSNNGPAPNMPPRQNLPIQQPTQNIQPLLPPRRNNAASNPRPPVHREQSISNDDDAPPSYEAAAKAEPYLGPNPAQNSVVNGMGHASASSRSPQASPMINTGGRPRGQSAYSTNSAQGVYPISPTTSRRRSGAQMSPEHGIGVTRRTNAGVQDRDKDCIVM